MNNTPSVLDEINGMATSLCSGPASARTKLTGALTIEVIRNRLLSAGISVSQRDVFIKGNSTEFDLLAVRPAAKPYYGIVFEPQDVAAALEIKFSGVYSQTVPTNLKQLFSDLTTRHSHIQCIYVTVCENPKFKYRMATEALGFPAFTLHWWTDYKRTSTRLGDGFHEIVACLQKALSRLSPTDANPVGLVTQAADVQQASLASLRQISP